MDNVVEGADAIVDVTNATDAAEGEGSEAVDDTVRAAAAAAAEV